MEQCIMIEESVVEILLGVHLFRKINGLLGGSTDFLQLEVAIALI